MSDCNRAPAIRVGDIGTQIVFDISDADGAPLDVSGASALTLYLTRPDGVTLTKTATLDTDGADGAIRYTTQAGDISAAGVWRIQAHVAGVGGFSGSTEERPLVVQSSRHG